MAIWLHCFAFHCKKPNGRSGAISKILHFAGKNEWPFGCNCKILYFPVKTTSGSLGARIMVNDSLINSLSQFVTIP